MEAGICLGAHFIFFFGDFPPKPSQNYTGLWEDSCMLSKIKQSYLVRISDLLSTMHRLCEKPRGHQIHFFPNRRAECGSQFRSKGYLFLHNICVFKILFCGLLAFLPLWLPGHFSTSSGLYRVARKTERHTSTICGHNNWYQCKTIWGNFKQIKR